MPFELVGIRKIKQATGVAPAIEQRIFALEDAVEKEMNDAFDDAKSLVESSCKTILLDRGDETSKKDPDLPDLMKTVLSSLPIVSSSNPDARNIRETIMRLLNALSKGVSEFRNLAGWSSHGPDGYTQPLDGMHIRLAAMSADTLSSFLLSAHQKFSSIGSRSRINYDDNTEFNDWFDERNGDIVLAGQLMQASKILYQYDPKHGAYKEELQLYRIEKELEEQEAIP